MTTSHNFFNSMAFGMETYISFTIQNFTSSLTRKVNFIILACQILMQKILITKR